ncbi:hypothetical protein [Rubrimonas cliftonensis]|uniref:hypothetical protein n=1 Tax=Rubrimonas cliftonensis TaxID=89524 RepID=UPI001114FD18|nr:hypothetical protein [Rubrimonas cliftonensis]
MAHADAGGVPDPLESGARDLTAIPARVCLLHVHGAEQPVRETAAVTLPARGGAGARHEEWPFALDEEKAIDRLAGRDHAKARAGVMRLRADRPPGGVEAGRPVRVAREIDRGETLDSEVRPTGTGPVQIVFGAARILALLDRAGDFAVFDLVGFALRDPLTKLVIKQAERPAFGAPLGTAVVSRERRIVLAQQVRQADMKNVADIGAQRERARPLAILEPDFARRKLAAPALDAGRLVARIGVYRVGRDGDGGEVAAQRVDHAIGVERPKTVVDQHLVDRRHIGADRPAEPAALRVAHQRRDRAVDRRAGHRIFDALGDGGQGGGERKRNNRNNAPDGQIVHA